MAARLFFQAIVLAVSFLALVPVRAVDKWFQLKSPNFTIVSCGKESDVEELALKLEQFRYVYGRLTRTNLVTLPVSIIAFANDRQMAAYKPVVDGKPKDLAAYFLGSDDDNLFVLELHSIDERLRAVGYHEYFHLLTRRLAVKWPTWLSEGLAEAYSTMTINKNTVTLGDLDEMEARVLNYLTTASQGHFTHHPFLPISRILEVNQQSPEYNHGDRQDMFYLESAALVRYLYFGLNEERHVQFAKYLEALEKGGDAKGLFVQIFGSIDLLSSEFHAFLKNPRSRVTQFKYDIEGAVPARFQSKPLPAVDVKYLLGELLTRIERYPEAQRHFEECAILDPKSPRASEGLALLSMVRDLAPAKARAHLARAIELKSENYLTHYSYAICEHDVMMENGKLNTATANRALTALENSVRLMPSHADSYHLMARIYLEAGDLESGEAPLRLALQLKPGEKSYLETRTEFERRKAAAR